MRYKLERDSSSSDAYAYTCQNSFSGLQAFANTASSPGRCMLTGPLVSFPHFQAFSAGNQAVKGLKMPRTCFALSSERRWKRQMRETGARTCMRIFSTQTDRRADSSVTDRFRKTKVECLHLGVSPGISEALQFGQHIVIKCSLQHPCSISNRKICQIRNLKPNLCQMKLNTIGNLIYPENTIIDRLH